MPELPEVETIKRDLERSIVNQTILETVVYDSRVIRSCTKKDFVKNCRGQTISKISRRGKAIIIFFQKGQMCIIQPMMTGQLVLKRIGKNIPIERATKIIFKLSNHMSLTYNDQRLFGRVNLVRRLEEMPFFRTLGLEPLEEEFSTLWLSKELKRRKGPIKSLLLNQHLVAGIGNIYASEILFESGIKPQRSASTLKQREIEALRKATVSVLSEAIDFRGTSMRNYIDGAGQKGRFNNRIRVYGRENEECISCKRQISKIVQAGRSTFYCKTCQR